MRFRFPVIANQRARWCGNPPVSGEMYRKAPERVKFTAIFGGNRYLVPINRGIATTSVRTGLAMTALFRQTPIVRSVPGWRIYPESSPCVCAGRICLHNVNIILFFRLFCGFLPVFVTELIAFVTFLLTNLV